MSYFKCFKYRSVNNNLIDSLINSTLYFASRDKLNDPFDLQIQLSQLIDSILKNDIDPQIKISLETIRSKRQFFDNFESGYKNFGICSFSMEPANTPMWTHYADEHRGIALHYDMPKNFLDNPKEIIGVSPVIYGSNVISDWLCDNAGSFESAHFEFVTELLKKVLTAKSPEWKYENEGRIIRPLAGAYVVPKNILKGVIFGLRTSAEDEKLIRNVVVNYYEDIQFSRVMRIGSDFGIQAFEIN